MRTFNPDSTPGKNRQRSTSNIKLSEEAFAEQRLSAVGKVRERAGYYNANSSSRSVSPRTVRHPLSDAIRTALLATGVVVWAGTTLEAENCTSPVCENSSYSLTIINHGEGKPRSSNSDPEGQQDNRRVDVGVVVQIPQQIREEKPEPITAAAKAAQNDGTFWITRDPSSLDRLLDLKLPASVTIESGQVVTPVKIELNTNYRAFVERWEIVFGSTNKWFKDKTIDAGTVQRTSQIEWDGKHQDNTAHQFEHNQEIEIAVRVYDRQGNYDQTPFKTLKFIDSARALTQDPVSKAASLTIESLNDEGTIQYSALEHQSIPVAGAKVRIHGQELKDSRTVTVNGDKIRLTDRNSFFYEALMPAGEHQFQVAVTDRTGKTATKPLSITVDDHYFFMLGLADLTVGKNKVHGSIEQLAVDEEHFGGDLFVDGRLAFYLKGRVKGKYLVTAQMDTGIESTGNLFHDFHRKDTQSLFRRLDPDQYYLVYGDDSSIVDDTDSQGKLFVRVDWDKSQALWGNFNTAFSGTEFAPFNRSLYGGRYQHRSMSNTRLGDSKTEVSAFASESQTAFRHNEFIGTGGSLYYLRDQDIIRGSEKVWVEVRRDGSEQVLSRIPLLAGRDYEIDEFQGRLILNRPLLSVSAQSGPSIIRDEPLDGDNTYLVVDYEYLPDTLLSGNSTTGVRGKHWLGDHVGIGATWVKDNRDVNDYQVHGVDVTLKQSDNTYLRFEMAQSESSQTSGSFASSDGGLTFTPFNSNTGVSSGMAAGLEVRVLVNELIALENTVSVAAWAKKRDAGFSVANIDTGADTTDIGIEAIANLRSNLSVSGRAVSLEKQTESRESAVALEAEYQYTDRLAITTAYRHVDNKNLADDSGGTGDLLAVKISVKHTEQLSSFLTGQFTLANSGTYLSNNLYTVGANYTVTERLSFSGELNNGDRGKSARLGSEWKVSDTYSLYGNYSAALNSNSGADNTLTLGQRKTLSNSLKVYSEHQFKREGNKAGQSHTLGLDQKFNRHASGNISLQVATLEDEAGNTIDRDAVSGTFEYQQNKSSWGTRLELRRDQGLNLDVNQWVTTNRFEYRQSESLRWQGKINASMTKDQLATQQDARFIEGGLGFALRPVTNDRLNLLGRVTYLHDLPPLSQSSATDERSLVCSFEGLYELSDHISIGGKLAHRTGETRTDRELGLWRGNDASLAAMRIGYKVPFGLDAMITYHWLNSDSTDSLTQGALISAGKTVGDNMQISLGYNFTTFDDNLSNDDYDVGGWFLNLVGKY